MKRVIHVMFMSGILFGCVIPMGWTLQPPQGTQSTSRKVINDTWVQPAGQRSTQPEVDLKRLLSQAELFQERLNRSLEATFQHPLAVLQDAKGTYLPGFGLVFHMEVNLYPLRVLSIFDYQPYTTEELQSVRKSKRERIQQLRNILSDLLLEPDSEFTALNDEHRVAVIVHFFNLPSERTEDLPGQLVIDVSYRDLEMARTDRISPTEFRKQVDALEF